MVLPYWELALRCFIGKVMCGVLINHRWIVRLIYSLAVEIKNLGEN